MVNGSAEEKPPELLLHSLKEIFICVLRKLDFFSLHSGLPPKDLTPQACGKLQELFGYLKSDTGDSELHSNQLCPAHTGCVLNKVGCPQIYLTCGHF